MTAYLTSLYNLRDAAMARGDATMFNTYEELIKIEVYRQSGDHTDLHSMGVR